MRTNWVTGAALFLMTGMIAALCLADPGTGSGTGSLGKEEPAGSGPVRFLTEAEASGLWEDSPEEEFTAAGLRWKNGTPACDEKSATVYIPCDRDLLREKEKEWNSGAKTDPAAVQEGWQEILAGLQSETEGMTVYMLEEETLCSPASAMRDGTAFHAFWGTEDSAAPFSIVLTGLPVLCIQKTDPEEIVHKEDHTGWIRLLEADPAPQELPGDEGAGAGDGQEPGSRERLQCRFHVRGNVTSSLAKKPFKISLQDAAGQKCRAGWLGMREDDDWILNPLFTDAARVREKTAYTVWEAVTALSEHPQVSSTMEYVEFFLDNEYQGIYGLMEPVDGKQLAMQPGDLLYKIDRWNREDPYLEWYEPAQEAQEREIRNENGFTCVEIRYPKQWDASTSWLPMQTFHRFVFQNGDPQTLREAGLETDLDSTVTLSLFCALTHAMDNNWKNTLLAAYRDQEGQYSLRRTVWDLNYVFGDVFVYQPEQGYTRHDPGTAWSYTPEQDSTCDFEAYLQGDPSLEKELADKWHLWRENGITAEWICALAEDNYQALADSGALQRELARWPQEKDSGYALQEMKDWIRNRFSYLDTLWTPAD